MTTSMNVNVQDSAFPLMEQLTFFHDRAMMILLMITLIVTFIMMSLFSNKFINRFPLEGQTIELVWTIAPAVNLIFIALPSLSLLYLLNKVNNPLISVKSIWHQQYWSYDLSDFKEIKFDSYMVAQNQMKPYNFLLLDANNRLPLPFKSQVRKMSSTDVIHS